MTNDCLKPLDPILENITSPLLLGTNGIWAGSSMLLHLLFFCDTEPQFGVVSSEGRFQVSPGSPTIRLKSVFYNTIDRFRTFISEA